jgi:hypothetical protein
LIFFKPILLTNVSNFLLAIFVSSSPFFDLGFIPFKEVPGSLDIANEGSGSFSLKTKPGSNAEFLN